MCAPAQAVMTLTTSAARTCPRDGVHASGLLAAGLGWAAANVVCNHRDVAASALSCLDALVGARPHCLLCLCTVSLHDPCVDRSLLQQWSRCRVHLPVRML